jgi:uncharacterized protein YdeI (YjbR/CyaY-like superfamily)
MEPEPPDNTVHPGSRARWRRWLQGNHQREGGVWVIFWRKQAGQPDMSYDEAVEEALCFGWIDSKPRALDAQRTMLWFAPRKAGSGWSAPNKRRVERAIATGRMTQAGMEKVNAAMTDGSWCLLDAVEALEIPQDLAAAFAAHPGADAQFAAFPPSARRGILEWIAQARKPDTRARRVRETAELAAQGKRANQWRAPRG